MAEKGATPSSQPQPQLPLSNNNPAVCIVEDWLKSVDLIQYTQAFLDNGYDDLEVCKQIGDDDLEAIGVKEEHREKLTRAVKILKEEGGTAVYFTLEECDTCQSDNETEVGENHEDDLESSSLGGGAIAGGNRFATIGNPSSNPKVFSAQYRGNSVDNSARRLATFSRMQLQLILRDKLVQGNIDLSNPPYTNMDQTLCGSSVTALALRFSQELNTHFAHVMDQLEELWFLANNAQNNGVYPSPSRSVYSRSQSVTYEPINYPGGSFRMHPPPLPTCPPPSTMSSSHHLPSRCTNNMQPHAGHIRPDPLSHHPTYVALDGGACCLFPRKVTKDAHGNIIEEKKKGSGSVFGRFLRNFGLRRSARKGAYKQHQGDLNASEMSMGEEDRMALMLLVKEGKISTQDALAVVQKYEEGRKQSVASLAGLEGLGKENDTPSKKSGTGKKKKGKPPKSQSSFSADDPNSQGAPFNISSPQSPCEHMVCRRVHSLSQLDSTGSNASSSIGGSIGGSATGSGPPLPPHHHHPSSPGLEGHAAQADFLARDKLMLTRAVSCSPACPPAQQVSSQGGDVTPMSRLQSPHPQQHPHHPYPAMSPPGQHYPLPLPHSHPGMFQHAQHHPYLPNHNHNHHHQYQQQQQQHHHRHLNKVDAIRERLTGKNVNGVSKTSSKTSLLSSGSDQSMDYGSSQLPLRTDLLATRRGTTGDVPNTYHSNSTVSMSSDNSPAPGRKKSAGLTADPRMKGNHRSASCSTGDDGISSENDDPEQRSRSRQQKMEDGKDGRASSQDNSRKPHYVKEAHIYRPPLLRQTSAPTGPQPNDRFLGQAMAVVDFTPGPDDDGFVPLKRGDVVNIMNMAQSGVWRGVVNGRPGKFRFEHVEVVIDPNGGQHPQLHASSSSHHHHHSNKGGNLLSPTPTPTVPGQLDIPRSVSDLLNKIGLEGLTNLFVMNGYDDLDIFADLEDSDLDALHIQDVDHRKRLLSAAKVLTDWNDKQSRSQTPSIKAVDSPSSRAGNSSCDSGCYTGGASGDGGGNHQHKHKGKKQQGDKVGKDGKGKKGSAASRHPCNSCGKPTKNNPNPATPSISTSGAATPSPLVPHHPYYTPGLYYGHSQSGGSGLSYYNPHGSNHLFSSSTLYHPSIYSRNSADQPANSTGSSMTTSATLTEMNMNITESSFIPPTHPHEGFEANKQQPYRDPRFNNLPSIGDGISLTEEDQEVIAITYGTHRRRKPSSASAQAGIISSSSSHHSQFEMSSSIAGDLINHYIPSNSSTSSSIYHQNYDPYAYSTICSDPNCSQCVAYSSCPQCAAAYHHYVNTTIRSDSKSSKMSYSSGCTQTTCLSPDQDENSGSGSGVIGGSNLATSPNRLNYHSYSSSAPSHYQPYYHHHQHFSNMHPPPHPPPLSPAVTAACTDYIPRPSTATSNKFSPSASSDQRVMSPSVANNIQQKQPGVKSPSLSLLTLQDNNSNNNPTSDWPQQQQQQQQQQRTSQQRDQQNPSFLALNSATVSETTTDPISEPSQPPSSSSTQNPTNTAANTTSQPWPNQSSRQESAGIANLYNTRGRNPGPKSDPNASAQIKSPLRSLMPLVTTKLSAERIQLSAEPYTSQKGECVIPPLLVQRYSEELRQDLKTIAQVMEKIREKELGDKEMAYVKNDNLSESCTSAVELQISSVKDFMFSIGLPMYNASLAEAKVTTVEQLIQVKPSELEKMTGADSRHLQRISHALEWVQAKLNSPTHRAKTKGPVDKV